MNLRRVAAPVLLVALALTLTACDPGANGGPTPSATRTVTPSATPTPTAEPIDEPAPAAATCENIVSPDTIAYFAANGLVITPPSEFAAKLASEGQGLAAFFDAGGVLCQVGGGYEAYEIYGYAVLSETQYAPVVADFLRDGYVETFGDRGVEYRVPDGAEGLPRLCYFRPDAWSVCGNDDVRLGEIITTLGLS
jgi:hypothetical protein